MAETCGKALPEKGSEQEKTVGKGSHCHNSARSSQELLTEDDLEVNQQVGGGWIIVLKVLTEVAKDSNPRIHENERWTRQLHQVALFTPYPMLPGSYEFCGSVCCSVAVFVVL